MTTKYKWLLKLMKMRLLRNNHNSPRPNIEAISNACRFLWELKFEPYRIVASVVGGVEMSFKRHGEHLVCIEFFNDGEVYLLFECGPEPKKIKVPDFMALARYWNKYSEYFIKKNKK